MMKQTAVSMRAAVLGALLPLFLLLPALLLPAQAQTISTQTVDVGHTGDVGQYTSQAIVNGNPAISYRDVTNFDLKFARNSAADGSGAWTTVTVDSGGNVGAYTSLAVVNGNPAISYYDQTNGDLKFARNSAADGSGTWTTVTVDSTGGVSSSPCAYGKRISPAASSSRAT